MREIRADRVPSLSSFVVGTERLQNVADVELRDVKSLEVEEKAELAVFSALPSLELLDVEVLENQVVQSLVDGELFVLAKACREAEEGFQLRVIELCKVFPEQPSNGGKLRIEKGTSDYLLHSTLSDHDPVFLEEKVVETTILVFDFPFHSNGQFGICFKAGVESKPLSAFEQFFLGVVGNVVLSEDLLKKLEQLLYIRATGQF